MSRKSKKDRLPNMPPGEPQGKHMAGFKGMKTEGTCMCGGCHPNAQAGKKYVKIIDPTRKKVKV